MLDESRLELFRWDLPHLLQAQTVRLGLFPIPQVKFCPTGGISLKNAPDYLSLKNILCVGGSWVAPKEAMAAGDWSAITRLASEARALR